MQRQQQQQHRGSHCHTQYCTVINAPGFPCRSPKKFFYRKDRTEEVYPDPFPGLEHEFAEINGVRSARPG